MDRTRIPQHIAIIMDGNGRWAMAQGKPRTAGHSAGVDTVTRITAECTRLGVKFLTLYTFSTENWNRPPQEVDAIMNLVITSLQEELFVKNNVRFRCIGDRSRLSEPVLRTIEHTEELTKDFKAMTVVVALSYSSRWEITKAVAKIAQQAKDGALDPSEITEQTINDNLETNYMPDPDLLIRTGGEERISNYLLWQIAYSELYFCDTFWPDFMEEDLHKAIETYQNRQRRFGKTEAQVEEEDCKQS